MVGPPRLVLKFQSTAEGGLPVLREIDPLAVVGLAAAAALALFVHQWDRNITASLKDPGMRTLVLKSAAPEKD